MLTEWLDPMVRYFAEQSGISVEDYSSRIGGEGIGTALEYVADYFSKGWLNAAIQFITGAIASSYAVWGRGVSPRLRKELISLGFHEMLRFLDQLQPPQLFVAQRSLIDFGDAWRRGDTAGAMATVLRTPAELQGMWTAIGVMPPAVAPEVPGQRGPFVPPPLPETREMGYGVTPIGGVRGERTTFGAETPAVVGRFRVEREPYGNALERAW